MAWKGVHIGKPSRLSFKDAQLVVVQDEGDVTLPLEDVAWIVLDTQSVTLTASLLSACMDYGVALISTDARHTPNGVSLPFHQHHRQAAVAAVQVGLSVPLKKRLWQALVVAKISNQAACLAVCERSVGALPAFAKRVASGDPENIEAQAAREYWSLLFDDFVRSNEGDLRNKMLNYGYAVVRAGLARALVASGLLPCFGVFHDSATNAFNLADDVFEPFRPCVDRHVFKLFAERQDPAAELTREHRQSLASILNNDIALKDETVSVLIATERVAASLVRAMEAADPALLEVPRM